MTAVIRPSSSICLLRNGPSGCEVLMARRGTGARFMGGAWVFPGGVVDDLDRSELALRSLEGVRDPVEAGWRAAALRELVEEAGIWLSAHPKTIGPAERPHGAGVYEAAVRSPFAAGQLEYFSNWITPSTVPVRFAARFYVAAVPVGVDGIADGREMDDVQWIGVEHALTRDPATFVLPFPTRKTLEHFAELGDSATVMDYARSLSEVVPILPRLRVRNDVLEAVLPWEPGYDELSDDPPDPGLLEKVTKVTTAAGDDIPEMTRP